jgi:amino acid transporter
MLFTAVSYGKMAKVYPTTGLAFNDVGCENNRFLRYITGWCMTMDYIHNPIVSTIFCRQFSMNVVPGVPAEESGDEGEWAPQQETGNASSRFPLDDRWHLFERVGHTRFSELPHLFNRVSFQRRAILSTEFELLSR